MGNYCPKCNTELEESTFIFSGTGLIFECPTCLNVRPPIQCRYDPIELGIIVLEEATD